jgi:Ca2+-dependent lipid-binding protein
MASIQITIIEARNLKKMDLLSESDAFIEIYLNHKSPKYRTKVIPNSQNPHWNETVVL